MKKGYLRRGEYQNDGRQWRDFHRQSAPYLSVSIVTHYFPNRERHRSTKRRGLLLRSSAAERCPANSTALHLSKTNSIKMEAHSHPTTFSSHHQTQVEIFDTRHSSNAIIITQCTSPMRVFFFKIQYGGKFKCHVQVKFISGLIIWQSIEWTARVGNALIS